MVRSLQLVEVRPYTEEEEAYKVILQFVAYEVYRIVYQVVTLLTGLQKCVNKCV